MKKVFYIFLFLAFSAISAYAAVGFNPADKSSDITLSNGNKTATCTGSNWVSVRGVTSHASGKYYAEFKVTDCQSSSIICGVGTSSATLASYPGNDNAGWGWMGVNDASTSCPKYHQGSGVTLGTEGDEGDTIMVAIWFEADIITGDHVWFGRNGVWMESGDPANNTDFHFSIPPNENPTLFLMGGLHVNGQDVVLQSEASEFTYTPPNGFSAWEQSFSVSGTLKEKEADASGAAYQYLLLSATQHSVYAHGTAASNGTWSETVEDTDDEYCGILIDNIGGAVQDYNYGTDTTASGTWSITNAGWADGDTVWAFFVDPDKVYKTIADAFYATSYGTISGTHQENGVNATGTLVYAAGFGTTSGTYDPKPIFDFATGD